MLLRLKTLASGRTGARPIVAETMAAVLNAGITPIVHEFGSLGCSGDLAPLSHCALVLMGEGRAVGPDGEERPVPELLDRAGIAPVELREKEGLALINGTQLITVKSVNAGNSYCMEATAAGSPAVTFKYSSSGGLQKGVC